MKKNKFKNIVIFLSIASTALFATGCGSGGGGTGATGLVNGTASVYGTAGCVPLNANQPIGFSAQSAYFSSQFFLAGLIPPTANDPDLYNVLYTGGLGTMGSSLQSGQIGVVSIGTGGAGGIYQTLPNRPDGSVSMTITPTTNTGYYSLATATGTVTISAARLSTINSAYQTYYMTNYTNYTQNCVSGIAVSLSIGNGSMYGGSATSTLYAGRVYLYLNGQQHGIYLQF